ncbi:MAG: transporter related protein, partial [Solirubrobacterales bacterium]|nr:transporter related protein [Solirubrobacterales bacterium]
HSDTGGGDDVLRCCAALGEALALGAAERLGEADLTVALQNPTSDDAFGLSLIPGEVGVFDAVTGDEDVELTLGPDHFAQLGRGELALQVAIMQGAVTYRGPVRRLLAVWPVLKACLRQVGRPSSGATPPAPVGPFDAVREGEPGEFWAINCRDVHKSFKKHDVLKGVDFDVPEGMITAILGPSGTGKSVLIKHLTGLLRPDRGEVLVHGRSLNEMPMQDLLDLRRRYGLLFQDGALWGSMNVYDNVALPLRQHTDLSEREIDEVVRHHLAQVGLEAAALSSPGALSGGMRKRAGFARALVLDPEIIIFDEPDSGLDPVRTALLCDLMTDVHRELGGTYIIITHDIRTVRQIADYIVVLWHGKVVEAGPARTILESPTPFVQQFLGGRTVGPLGMD